MPDLDRSLTEKILINLDDGEFIFPGFTLKKDDNGELVALGAGVSGTVYEMYYKDCPKVAYALKVTGFNDISITSEAFYNSTKIQYLLGSECDYIMQIAGAKELFVKVSDDGEIVSVNDEPKEKWEEKENGLHLQFVLSEKLESIIKKDRFGNATLNRSELNNPEEIMLFASEIGSAIAKAHINNILHRDIKLENIFWDPINEVYKLGDFGMAKETVYGTAETCVYTDGYGAPEIEAEYAEGYTATADIYSFGITLYLLFNNLKFPFSKGYYSNYEIQYNPEYTFPAPENASPGMSHIIRNMCSYDAKDRYQSVNQMFDDLLLLLKSDGGQEAENRVTEDMVTEICHKESGAEETDTAEQKEYTRAEQKERHNNILACYREDCIKYGALLSVLIPFVYIGFKQSEAAANTLLIFITIGLLFEAVFQKVKEFHIVFGVVLIVLCGFSAFEAGVCPIHVLTFACVILGSSTISVAGAVGTGLWIVNALFLKIGFLNIFGNVIFGILFTIAIAIVIYKFFEMRITWRYMDCYD